MYKSNVARVDLEKIVKEKVSITQILERYGLMTTFCQEQENLFGPCPIHQGNNPREFKVSLARNCWICMGRCRSGGDILSFVARKEGVSIRQSAHIISDWFL